MSRVNGMNGGNEVNRMNRGNQVNEMNGMNGVSKVSKVNGVNGMNGMNKMNKVNGVNKVNKVNEVNGMNGMNEWNIPTRARSKQVTNYKKLGQGSFGSIFSPPPENDGYTPTTKDIVKIFNSKNEYNKTIKNAEMLTKTIPSLAINTVNYTRKYKFKNLPYPIQTALKERKNSFIRGKRVTTLGVNNNSDVFMVRTPYLGHSCIDIFNKNKEFIDKLKNVNCLKLLSEINKCLHTLQDIINAEYIHADIRPPNVMYDFNNNTLTIIDFDLLMPKNDYLKKHILYPQSTYTKRLFPIDSAPLFEKYDKDKTVNNNIRDIIEIAYSHLNNKQYSTFKSLCASIKYQSSIYNYDTDSSSQAVEKIKEYTKIDTEESITVELVTSIKTEIFNGVYPYMDLWGFGYSILLLCIVIYKNNSNDYTIFFIMNTLIPGILNPHINERFNINDAINQCEYYIKRYNEGMAEGMTGGKYSGKRRRKHKTKRRKTRKLFVKS